jgi:hypothetical protein
VNFFEDFPKMESLISKVNGARAATEFLQVNNKKPWDNIKST